MVASADVRDQSGPVITQSVGPGTTRADTGEDTGPVADAILPDIQAGRAFASVSGDAVADATGAGV